MLPGSTKCYFRKLGNRNKVFWNHETYHTDLSRIGYGTDKNIANYMYCKVPNKNKTYFNVSVYRHLKLNIAVFHLPSLGDMSPNVDKDIKTELQNFKPHDDGDSKVQAESTTNCSKESVRLETSQLPTSYCKTKLKVIYRIFCTLDDWLDVQCLIVNVRSSKIFLNRSLDLRGLWSISFN